MARALGSLQVIFVPSSGEVRPKHLFALAARSLLAPFALLSCIPLYAQQLEPPRARTEPAYFGAVPCEGFTDSDSQVEALAKEVCAYRKELLGFSQLVAAKFARQIKAQLEKYRARDPSRSEGTSAGSYHYYYYEFDLLGWVEVGFASWDPGSYSADFCYKNYDSEDIPSGLAKRLEVLRAESRQWRLVRSRVFEIIPVMLSKSAERNGLLLDSRPAYHHTIGDRLDQLDDELDSLQRELDRIYLGPSSPWELTYGFKLENACVERPRKSAEHLREKWRAADFDALFGKPKPQSKPAGATKP